MDPRHFPRNNTLDFLFGRNPAAASSRSSPSLREENQEGSKVRSQKSTPVYAIDFVRKCEGETIIVYKTSRYLCANCSKIFQSKFAETYPLFNRANVLRGDPNQPDNRPQRTRNAARIAQESPGHLPRYQR